MPLEKQEPELSIVIPAYNEERRLPHTLRELGRSIEKGDIPRSLEVVVVDDGSEDGTIKIKPPADEEIWKEISYTMIGTLHRGKGSAVREGLRFAKGKWVLIADADLSTPFKMYSVLKEKAVDGAIASRGLNDSMIKIRQPGLRHELGRTFNAFVRFATGLPYFDTQCGFKLLKREAAKTAADYLTLKSFAFDVEMLMILCQAGFRIVEVPVEWSHMEDSRVRAWKDGIAMGFEVIKLEFSFLCQSHPASKVTRVNGNVMAGKPKG